MALGFDPGFFCGEKAKKAKKAKVAKRQSHDLQEQICR